MRSFLQLICIIIFLIPGLCGAGERLRLATTTSTDNSGLLSVLHPVFEAKYNIKVDVIAVGTGKALRLGQNGDVDFDPHGHLRPVCLCSAAPRAGSSSPPCAGVPAGRGRQRRRTAPIHY